MTDEVDITAPNLPRVAKEPDVTQPTLPKVQETVAALEPVPERPATTLELEDDTQENIVTNRKLPAVRPSPSPKLDALASGTPASGRRPVKRPLGGDGFEGSADSLPEAVKVSSQSAQLAAVVRRGGWWLAVLALAALGLSALLIWQLF